MLERPSYPPGLTVKEYLGYVQNLYGTSSTEFDLTEWSQRLSLPLDRWITGLSAGMRRKMSLLASLIGQTEVVIMNEPTANVDPIAREEILQFILDIHRQFGTKFLISSHILFDLEKLATEVIILSEGQIIEAGKTLDILKKYERTNEYVCITLKPERLATVLQKQEWVLESSVNINRVIIKTEESGSQTIFHKILQVATQEKTQLLSISQTSSLIQVFRSLNNE